MRVLRLSIAVVSLSFVASFMPSQVCARTVVELPDVAPSISTPIVFVDALQQSTPWTSASPLALSGSGDVLSLRAGQVATRVVFVAGQTRVAGDYTLLYDGQARFAIDGAHAVSAAPGRMVIRVGAAPARLSIVLTAVDAADPPRYVRLILPGFIDSYARRPFYPGFVSSLSDAGVLRFSAWSHGATLATSQVWPLRPRVADATQARDAGVAWEYQIELANETGADPWFVIPAGATNAYVAGVGDLVHRFLDPRLHATFEYSDGMLASGSLTNAYGRLAAHNTGLGDDPTTSAGRWYAVRSQQVESLVGRIFGSDASRMSSIIENADGSASDSRGENWQRTSLISWTDGSVEAHRGTVPWNAPFRVGSDRAPVPDRIGPPPLGLHFTPLISSAARSPQLAPSIAAASAIGDPLPAVDLTTEGTIDWLAAVGGGRFERRAPNGGIAVRVAGQSMSASSRGFAALSWRNGTMTRAGTTRIGQTFGVGSIIHIDAPTGPGSRVLRVYVAFEHATATFDATMGGTDVSRTALAEASSHEYVYTLVYRSGSAARVDVAVSIAGPAGARITFRGATLSLLATDASAALPNDLTTYHNGLFRLGWNDRESQLNTTNVATQFGLLRTLQVDGNVLAQPLYLERYAPLGGRDVVIVATEHASIYEFDADTGAQINMVNFGPSQNSNDVGCLDIRPEYGITSTPVIDPQTHTLYAVVATEPSKNVFKTRLHALDIATLADKIAPVDITASETITNGLTLSFDPQHQMNRSSLVLANGSIYVPIGSHCDNNASAVSGWVLRYDYGLNQIGAFATDEDAAGYLLSSVWMTGFAPAIDTDGTLFAVTGNGSFDANDGGKNFGESVIRLSADLSSDLDYFTPSNFSQLNNGDTDFGSGGVMLLPTQQGPVPNVAVAQGKASTIYLLDRAALGGEQIGDAGALQHISGTGGGVWGGPAYYSGPTGQFVYYQAGGAPLRAYAVKRGMNGAPRLALSSTGPSYAGYGGSLPVVSSYFQQPGTGIVWLIKRSSPLMLEAYDATDVSQVLFTEAAGNWTNPQANGFVTPLVADGKVFVPASGTVTEFGIGGSRSQIGAAVHAGGIVHEVHGVVVARTSSVLRLRLRDSRVVTIDIRPAVAVRDAGVLPIGKAVVVYGTIDRSGAFHATSIGHTSQDPKDWPADS